MIENYKIRYLYERIYLVVEENETNHAVIIEEWW